jgi:hypothetical protein
MKAWRCDLTGLSQLHNLYFVACNDEILVYQPEFPDQTFAPEPKLILKPPATSPYLYPGIDEEDPHSITRILVESLGNEEILLGTCDDGDFFIYRIEAIRKALSATSSEEWPECGPEIPLFLHQNMGASAWGLAVHKEARMIAVSANTHEVRVLAFALASEDGEQLDSDSMDERIRDDETDPHPEDFPFPRKYDHHFTLEAKHNVPSVSFNNNDQDPAGRWLYGTCITGEVWLWDLHAPPLAPYRIFQMGFCASAQLANKAPQVLLGPCRCDNCLSHPHASWGAMFLDPRSAHKFPSMSGIPQSARCAPYFHDTGVQKERFRLLPTLSTALDNMTSDNTDSEMAVSDGGSNDSNEDSDMTDDASVDDADGSLNSHGGSYDNTDDMEEDDVQDQEHDEETYNEPSIPSMQLENPQPDVPAGPGTPAYMANLLASGTPWSILVQAMYGDGDDDDDEDDDGGEDHLSHAHNIFSLSNYARSRLSPKPYCEISDHGFPISEVCIKLHLRDATILIRRQSLTNPHSSSRRMTYSSSSAPSNPSPSIPSSTCAALSTSAL